MVRPFLGGDSSHVSSILSGPRGVALIFPGGVGAFAVSEIKAEREGQIVLEGCSFFRERQCAMLSFT